MWVVAQCGMQRCRIRVDSLTGGGALGEKGILIRHQTALLIYVSVCPLCVGKTSFRDSLCALCQRPALPPVPRSRVAHLAFGLSTCRFCNCKRTQLTGRLFDRKYIFEVKKSVFTWPARHVKSGRMSCTFVRHGELARSCGRPGLRALYVYSTALIKWIGI